MKLFCLGLMTFLMGSFAQAEAVRFSLPSSDQQAELSGILTYPAIKNSSTPLVVMVPGTGLFDTEVHLGHSGTDKDFIFTTIEKRLLDLGFAVVRMNYRGVFCNFMNFPGKCTDCPIQEQVEVYKKACFDTTIRAKVTPANMRDDVEQIYSWAVKQESIDHSRTIMFGHSEGSTHIARLIEQKRISPKAVVFMGGVTESLDSLIHWQIVTRFVENLVLMDTDSNGEIHNDEITAKHKTSVLSIFPLDTVLSPSGFWTESSITSTKEAEYTLVQTNALAQDDFSPYPSESFPQASYVWWKMFFTPESPIINALADFDGPVIYHNGDLDSQTNAVREENFLKSYQGAKPENVQFITHPGKGHTLGTDPLMGPISEDSMDILIKSFEEILKK